MLMSARISLRLKSLWTVLKPDEGGTEVETETMVKTVGEMRATVQWRIEKL